MQVYPSHLEVGPRALPDVIRRQPLPHLDQSETLVLVHVEHSLYVINGKQSH